MQMAPKLIGYASSFKEKRKALASDLEEPNLVVVLYLNCLFVCIYVSWEQFR